MDCRPIFAAAAAARPAFFLAGNLVRPIGKPPVKAGMGGGRRRLRMATDGRQIAAARELPGVVR